MPTRHALLGGAAALHVATNAHEQASATGTLTATDAPVRALWAVAAQSWPQPGGKA